LRRYSEEEWAREQVARAAAAKEEALRMEEESAAREAAARAAAAQEEAW
jgi:hypothetical protein